MSQRADPAGFTMTRIQQGGCQTCLRSQTIAAPHSPIYRQSRHTKSRPWLTVRSTEAELSPTHELFQHETHHSHTFHSLSSSSLSGMKMIFCILVIILGGVLSGAQSAKLGRSPSKLSPNGVSPYCGPCNVRTCPYVDAETCPGRVIKDQCDCCPICEMTPAGSSVNQPILDPQNNACAQVHCKALQVCTLNIQGIPLCRCPSVYFCRQQKRRDVCGRDGQTYKSRCFLQIAECSQNKKIRVAHRGQCKNEKKKKRIQDEDTVNTPVVQSPHIIDNPLRVYKNERPVYKTERPDRNGRPGRVNHKRVQDETSRSDRMSRLERPDKSMRPERKNRPERLNRGERLERKQKKKQRRRERIKRRFGSPYFTG